MSFGNSEKVATSLNSEEFISVIEINETAVSYNVDEFVTSECVVLGKEVIEKESYISLIVGEPRTNLNNWDIKTSDDQYIFNIIDGYVKVSDLKIGDILKHIDGITVEVKVISNIEISNAQYNLKTDTENYFVNGILFKN